MSQSRVYLTIDDSPSDSTYELVDFMVERDIPALLFCRGDLMEDDMEAVIYAIENGMTIGNHLYSHTRSSQLGGIQNVKSEILKTESLIDLAYERAGRQRPGKYIRFPYIDRGDGDDVERKFPKLIDDMSAGKPVALGQSNLVQNIQAFLAAEGFVQPFADINHPLYHIDDIAEARDCLFTYSTCDWMLTTRHCVDKCEGDFPHKTIGDLTQAIDDDCFLQDPNLSHVVLIHDQPELLPVTQQLISHFKERGFIFEDVACSLDSPKPLLDSEPQP